MSAPSLLSDEVHNNTRRGLSAKIAPFLALWRLATRNTFSAWRLILQIALGAGLVGLAAGIANNYRSDAGLSAAEVESNISRVVDVIGLGLLLPAFALLFGSAALGELRDEKSLVYVWLSPAPRWLTPFTSLAATFLLFAPIAVASMALTAAVSDLGTDYIVATAVATGLGALAYCALFVLSSLLFRNPLGWGLGYIIVWETTVGSLAGPLRQISVRHYISSIVVDGADLANTTTINYDTVALSVVVLVAITVASLVVATMRLNRMAID